MKNNATITTNMKPSTQPYKGARDFYPEDKRIQKWMFKKWRKVFESFGYEEYDAPILEPTDLYLMKGNQEIIDEQTYTFVDRGDRSVTIRTEMTPTVSRMVAGRRQELTYPLRWYSIPNLWRYERTQRGRLREFWQPNVDIFGVETLDAELELIQIADAVLKEFGGKPNMYSINISSRKLIDRILKEKIGLDDTQTLSVIRLIDKKAKMDEPAFRVALEFILAPSEREAGKYDELMSIISAKTIEELPDDVRDFEEAKTVQVLLLQLKTAGVTNAVFDVSLMRGFDYYTDIVFEVFDTSPENNRAMMGGGRYDGLVGQFGVEPVPTVGFAFGDAPLMNFLEVNSLMPRLKPEVELYVMLLGNVTMLDANKPIQELRQMGAKVFVDFSGRKIDKQFKTALKMQVPYALFIGDQEIASQQFTLKNLKTETEEKHSLQRIVSIIKDQRG